MKSIIFLIISLLQIGIPLHGQIPDSLKYQSLDPKEFQARFKTSDPALLIDVREPFEIKKKIKGSVNLPSRGNIDFTADTISKEKAIFLYCTSGFRSRRVAVTFYDKGFRKIYSLQGGINAWKKNSLPLVKNKKPHR